MANNRDIYIDPTTGDIALTATGDLRLSQDDTDGLKQAVYQELAEFYGEWFLDPTSGFPWFQAVLVANPNLPYIRNQVRKKVEGVDGITSVTYLNLDWNREERILLITFTASTKFGVLQDLTFTFNPTDPTA